MKGRDLVLGVIASLVGAAIWHLVKNGAKREAAPNFKAWYPTR